MNQVKYSNEVVVQHKPVAVEIAEFAQSLANRAAELKERVNEKLHPVMQSDYPRPGDSEYKDPEFPPLFSDLRSSFQNIAASPESIEHALKRTEL